MSNHNIRKSLPSRIIEAILAQSTKLGPLLPSITFKATMTLPGGSTQLRLQLEAGPLPVQPTIPDSFPKFKQLPPEIRTEIWKLAFGPPRVFRNQAEARLYGVVPMVVNHKPPPATQACKEARKISLEVGRFLFGVKGGKFKSLWFNLSSDIFYWDAKEISWWQMMREDNHDLSRVKKVAINLREDILCYFDDCCEVDTLFPRCGELYIVLQHTTLTDNDVYFFHTEDDDLTTFDFTEEDRRICWEDIKSNIYTNYGKIARCNRLEDEGVTDPEILSDDEDLSESDIRKIPSIHAVEVVPIRTKT